MQSLDSGSYGDGVHRIGFRVYYEDTDAAGIVYYANYLKFAERARTEALRGCGIEQSQLPGKDKRGFVVRHCAIDFISPAALDDVVTVETMLEQAGGARWKMRQRLLREARLLAEMRVELAMIDASGRPGRIPREIRDAVTGKMQTQMQTQTRETPPS